jgi:8-oxo-dGTP diphosphatase
MAPKGFSLSGPRHTARGIIIHNGQILLMERWRPGIHYFSIPGGGIEKGETPEQTVAREIEEETTVIAKVDRKVIEMRDGETSHEIFLCEYISGQPHLPQHAPEYLHMSDDNRFKPGWMSVSNLPDLPFTYWQPVKKPLVEGMRNGFGGEVVIVSSAGAG